jgi:hypothetical protein
VRRSRDRSAFFERTGSRAIVNLHGRLIASLRSVGDTDASCADIGYRTNEN